MTEPARLREWFLANVLVTWKSQAGPAVRKGYRSDEDADRITALRDLRDWLRGKLAACDELLAEVTEPKPTGVTPPDHATTQETTEDQ